MSKKSTIKICGGGIKPEEKQEKQENKKTRKTKDIKIQKYHKTTC